MLNTIENNNISGFIFIVPNKYECSFSNCVFSSLARATPISADSVESSLLFDECLFDSIQGDKIGGCIHVSCEQQAAKISLDKVIARECETENREGSFGYFKTKGNFNLEDTVISKCASIQTGAHYCIYIHCPNAVHQGGNITDCYAFSDLLAFQTDNSKSSWCQFIRNALKQQAVVVFQIGVHTLQYSTVIGNTNSNPETNGKILYSYMTQKVTISQCYIKENKARFIIDAAHTVCIVQNCVVDNWKVNQVSSSSGIVYSGTIPITSVVYPVKLNNRCESRPAKVKSNIALIAIQLLKGFR